MLREIQTHRTNSLNEDILVETWDEPSKISGANSKYRVHFRMNGLWENTVVIPFQNGPRFKDTEQGTQTLPPNGLTHEVLLAIMMDRLEAFQKGNFACPENAKILKALKEAMKWSKARTEKRVKQGIEGTHKP